MNNNFLSTPTGTSIGPYKSEKINGALITNIGTGEGGNNYLGDNFYNPIHIIRGEKDINLGGIGPINTYEKFLKEKFKNDIKAGANVLQVNLFGIRKYRINSDETISQVLDDVSEKNIKVAQKIAKKNKEKEISILPSFGPASDNCYDSNTLYFGKEENNLKKYIDFHKAQLEPVKETLGQNAEVLGETFNAIIDAKGFILAAKELGLKPTVSFSVDIDGNLIKENIEDKTPLFGDALEEIIRDIEKENNTNFKYNFGVNCSPRLGILNAVNSTSKDNKNFIKIIYSNSSSKHPSDFETGNIETYSDSEKKIQSEFMNHISNILGGGITLGYCCGGTTKDIKNLVNSVLKNKSSTKLPEKEENLSYWKDSCECGKCDN